MGKFATAATDVFFCLLGIFAALYAMVPKESFGTSFRPLLSVTWPATAVSECLIQLEMTINSETRDIGMPDPDYGGFIDNGGSGEGQCRWQMILDDAGSGGQDVVLEVILPFLIGCAEATFADAKPAQLCTNGTTGNTSATLTWEVGDNA